MAETKRPFVHETIEGEKINAYGTPFDKNGFTMVNGKRYHGNFIRFELRDSAEERAQKAADAWNGKAHDANNKKTFKIKAIWIDEDDSSRIKTKEFEVSSYDDIEKLDLDNYYKGWDLKDVQKI